MTMLKDPNNRGSEMKANGMEGNISQEDQNQRRAVVAGFHDDTTTRCTRHTQRNHNDIVEITNPPAMQLESARKGEPNADALYGPGRYENIILGMESREFSTRNTISEKMARSELEATEKDAFSRIILSKSIMPSRSPRIPKRGKRCRQSGCVGIFRK